MKHLVGVAEMNSWVRAVTDAVNLGLITEHAGEFLSDQAAEYTRDYLEGKLVNGEKLTSLVEDDLMFEELLDEIRGDKLFGYEPEGYKE